jgi:primosomal protein N' (replication factor Y)
VVRIDRDTTRRKGSLQKALERIQAGQPAILVGTQMLAKGHHFSNLTLAVILDADAGFLSADFRGPEHAGQLILQVAGRTGRGERPGTVLIQTRHPDLPLLHTLLKGDYRPLANALLADRRAIGLPPFGYLAMFRAESPRREDAESLLETLADLLADCPVQTMGPIPAPLERRQGRYRFQLLVLSSHRPTLHQTLEQALASLRDMPEARRCRWQLDVDPLDML